VAESGRGCFCMRWGVKELRELIREDYWTLV
jgi:hypothetical protein